MQKVLIITDNPIQAKRFKNEVWPLIPEGSCSLSFKCSPYTLPESFDPELNIVGIDLKDDGNLQEAIEHDLIISIHCKQLFPKLLVEKVRCINVHPGYNPINRGWYPQVFAIINHLPIGATIHEIDEYLDHGSIIAREFVDKFEYDTSKTIYDRVLDKEIMLLKENINDILSRSYKLIEPEGKGNLFLKKDFKELCKLDLSQSLTLKEAIDLLRALTHGDYKNAYFIDESGRKVFVSINLEHEEG